MANIKKLFEQGQENKLLTNSSLSELGDPIESADFVKSRLVQPDGFEVSKKATGFHHIKDDVARSHGEPLRSVLQEFLADVLDITARGGRVVAHHLEFDIILRELR